MENDNEADLPPLFEEALRAVAAELEVDEGVLPEVQQAKLVSRWKSIWGRVEALWAMQAEWSLRGIEAGMGGSEKIHGTGDVIYRKSHVAMHFYAAEDRVATVEWDYTENEPRFQFYGEEGAPSVWTDILYEIPDPDPRTEFTDAQAIGLFIGLQVRVKMIMDMWLASCETWKAKGVSPVSEGIVVGEEASVGLYGFDYETCEDLVFIEATNSDLIPRLTYYDE